MRCQNFDSTDKSTLNKSVQFNQFNNNILQLFPIVHRSNIGRWKEPQSTSSKHNRTIAPSYPIFREIPTNTLSSQTLSRYPFVPIDSLRKHHDSPLNTSLVSSPSQLTKSKKKKQTPRLIIASADLRPTVKPTLAERRKEKKNTHGQALEKAAYRCRPMRRRRERARATVRGVLLRGARKKPRKARLSPWSHGADNKSQGRRLHFSTLAREGSALNL